MDRLVDVRRKGDMVCFVVEGDGKQTNVRCRRNTGLAAIKLAERKWCELDLEERKASVVPIGKR